ncbi:MAG: hypothetical protein JWR69_3475, partial [Pedosphaera sp.]|nr:hypothetical protein [Pedosphaera sp.]
KFTNTKQPSVMKNHRYSSGTRVTSLITAVLGLSLLPLLLPELSTAQGDDKDAAERVTGTYAGSDVWFAGMRKTPTSQAMLRALTGTNIVMDLPPDYVEVAGTITFPDGNPFPDQQLPELKIVCRDQNSDSVVRSPRLDESGHFYTVLKKGKAYEFYWKKPSSKERFCTLELRPDAQPRQKLTVPYRPPGQAGAGRTDDTKPLPRNFSVVSKEYDLAGFPAQPTSEETVKIAEAIKTATGTSARANAHELLANYYKDKGDGIRARSEFKKAKKLRVGVPE